MRRVVLKIGGASTTPAAAPLRGLVTSCYEVAVVHGVGLRADRLLFVTDGPGRLLEGSVVEEIGADAAEELLEGGALEGGILPKLRAAVTAARLGVAAEIGATAVVA